MEKAADAIVAPKISFACRTIRRRWLKILKPKLRMTTPRKLISQSPPPGLAAFCQQAIRMGIPEALNIAEYVGNCPASIDKREVLL